MPEPAFKLREIAAAGTFGTVCIVQDMYSGKLVALKVLKQAHLHRPRVIARARDEAAMLSCIDHPNVIHVQGLMHVGERPIVVMAWVRGVSLEELVKSNKQGLPVGVAIELLLRATQALQVAYETIPEGSDSPMAIIHRDIKPSNMLLSIDGVLKMVDFGIARGEFEGKQAKTMSMVLGARGYLAPERLDGHDDKVSVDIYSLGICLYEFLTGRHVVLSVHHQFHTEALEKAMARFQPKGLDPEARNLLSELASDMCLYHEEKRPNHQEVINRLRHVRDKYNLDVDMQQYAHDIVLPMFRARNKIRPIDHPGYPDLAFLDRTSSACANPAPPDVDIAVAEILRDVNWLQRQDEIDLLLIQNPHWTEAPFLEAIPETARPWWQFWGDDKQLTAKQVVALLMFISRHKLNSATRRRLLPLKGHPDPKVVEAINTILAM